MRSGRDLADLLVPITFLVGAFAVVALFVAFSAAQNSGTTSTASADQKPMDMAMSSQEASTPTLPDATAGSYDAVAKRYDPHTRPVAAGPKTFVLTAAEQRIKVGNKVVDEWTFNGTSPGPVLRAVVGDRITIRVRNSAASKMAHSLDFHAARMPMGGGAVQVAPGKTGTFSFTAQYPGVFMYHCATAPVLEHIGHGMSGMLIVQPKNGFGPPMPEYAITQSELYANYSDMQGGRPAAMAFNGIPNQYVDAPIRLQPGSRVRLFVLNAGPNKQSSFHVVGTVFDRVLLDGNPRNATFGRQAISLPASGSGVFEMQLVGSGSFPMVTHQFNDVVQGAVGMLSTAQPAPAGSAPMAH
jgi:nitrite reductase (NO-forming)